MTRDEMDEVKRHFDVVAEGIAGQVRIVAEGHQLLVEGQNKIVQRLDGLDSRAERTEQQLDGLDHRVEQRFDGLDHRVERIEQRLDGLDARAERIEQGLEGVEQATGGLGTRIDRLESEIKAMLRLSFVELERRVLDLEATLIKLVKRVDRLEGGPSQ